MKYRRDFVANNILPGIQPTSTAILDLLEASNVTEDEKFMACCRVMASLAHEAVKRKELPPADIMDYMAIAIAVQFEIFMRDDSKEGATS